MSGFNSTSFREMWIKENFKYPLREHFLYSAAKLLVVVNKAIGLVSSPFWQQIKSVSSKIFTQSKQGARGVNCSSSYCVNRRKTLQRLGIAMKTSSAESITPQLQICTIQIRVTPVKNILILKEQNEIAETIMTLIVMIDQQSRHWSCSTAHRHTSKNSTNLVLRST